MKNPDGLVPLDARTKVLIVEDRMLAHGGADVADSFPVRHFFSPGVYARELFIPKGYVLTGAIHKYPQLNIMSKGVLDILTDDGWKRVEAPFTVVSPANTKRLAYAHEDTVWTTILGTDETDVDVIRKEFTCDTEEEYRAFAARETIKEIA